MKFFSHSLLLLLLFAGCHLSSAQQLAIGQWRDHLPYNKAIRIAEAPDKVYCATPYAVFSYDKSDQSIERISKATGLSDVGVSTITYHPSLNLLIIAYFNGNIDLYGNDGVININDIKRSLITAGKSINHITLYNNFAYLACGYGISVLDVAKNEIKETYFIGNNGAYLNINDISFSETRIYAATNEGLYSAPINSPNLSNFNSWSKDLSLPQGAYSLAEFFNGNIYVGYAGLTFPADSLFRLNNGLWEKITQFDNTGILALNEAGNKIVATLQNKVNIYDTNWNTIETVSTYQTPRSIEPRHSIPGENGILWIADFFQGLIKHNGQTNERIVPSGAASVFSYQMDIKSNVLAVATGKRSRSNGNNWWRNEGVMLFADENWTTINYENTPGFGNIYDLIAIDIDPSDYNRIYAGSFGWGVIALLNGTLNKIYDESNSSLLAAPPPNQSHIGITGIAFDGQNNLWVTNSNTVNALSVKTPAGDWKSFAIPELSNEMYIGNILVNQSGHKWIELPHKGIVVFDDNGTITNTADDRSFLLKSGEGSGGLNSLSVMALAEDLDGKIWVGTESGIEVFYAPSGVFSGGNFDAQRILVSQGGYTGYLLETEVVIAIAVDGANRKWIGTDGAGLFLLSADGSEQIEHFTEENSPLLSNFISCIAINERSGEVFIGTENGICSYKSDATGGSDEFNNVYSYPNPVRSGYEGPIAIKNLVTGARVKITDVSGSLVYETTALGGQAIWYGKDFNGTRVKSGVYFAFCSDNDGARTFITKILVLK